MRVDEVVGELLGVHVADPDVRVEAARVVADGVQQVGLAQPGVAVDEQRVVGLGRRLGDGDGGGVGEPVAGADDEGVEGVLRVQPGVVLAHHDARRLDRRLGVRRIGQVVGEVVGDLRCPRMIDQHLDRDAVAELIGQRLLDVWAQLRLEHVLGEVVAGHHHQRIVGERHRFGEIHPGPLGFGHGLFRAVP